MSVKFIDLRSNFKTKFNLIVSGQGVFQFKSTSPYLNLLQFRVYSSDRTTGIQIEFTEKSVYVTNMLTLRPYIDSSNNQQDYAKFVIIRNIFNGFETFHDPFS